MLTVKFEYELGEVLRDVVTGFTGAVMVRSQYSTGCIHYGLSQQKLNNDGKTADWEHFDSSRLQRVDGILPVQFNYSDGKVPSGPFPKVPQA